jgi:hypothetical protein
MNLAAAGALAGTSFLGGVLMFVFAGTALARRVNWFSLC